jgi:general secretion pathway protein F
MWVNPFSRRVGLKELSLLTRRLATLLSSSVPVFEAVTSLYEQEEPGELKNLLARVRSRLAEGTGLARALAAEPKVFQDNYVSMVAAGEAGGALDSVLEKLADFLEDQEAVRNKLITSLTYPLLMILVGAGVMLFLMTFVIPKITALFENNKAALPMITVLLIKTSTLIRQGWWVLLLLVLAVTVIWKKIKDREAVRFRKDRLFLHLPIAGPLTRYLILARFSKILGLLLMSGVPIIRSIEITGQVVVNRVYRTFLTEVKEELIQGVSLSAALKKSPLFSPLLVYMIGVGEKSGQLEEMLFKAGETFSREFDNAVSRSMGLLEPVLVLGMGLCVGLIVLAVLLPIFELNQLIK